MAEAERGDGVGGDPHPGVVNERPTTGSAVGTATLSAPPPSGTPIRPRRIGEAAQLRDRKVKAKSHPSSDQ